MEEEVGVTGEENCEEYLGEDENAKEAIGLM